MVYAGILSGGIGSRMLRTDMPKQFLMLGGKPIIIHTIDQFVLNTRVDEIFVAVPAAWFDYTKDLLRMHYPDNPRIHVLTGGKTRNETLMRLLEEIEKKNGIGEEDVIISHDAVRPFVTRRIIDDNIDAVLEYGAVDTVVPAFDTIVESEDGQRISDIPLRSKMYQGQTPQSFNICALRRAYAKLSAEEVEILTDAAKIMVLQGEHVHLVQGDVSNTKVTTPYDLKVAQAMLESEKV